MARGCRKVDKTKQKKCGEKKHDPQVINKYKILWIN